VDDSILDRSGCSYIRASCDLRLGFRHDRKLTAVPGNAPLGDVAQRGTETRLFPTKMNYSRSDYLPRPTRNRYSFEGKGEAKKSATAEWKSGRNEEPKETACLQLAREGFMVSINALSCCWFVPILIPWFLSFREQLARPNIKCWCYLPTAASSTVCIFLHEIESCEWSEKIVTEFHYWSFIRDRVDNYSVASTFDYVSWRYCY
jgi:hypothetical protein